MTRLKIAMMAAAAVAAIAGAVISLKGEAPQASPAPMERDGRVYGLGSVEARVVSRLGFEINGTLAELRVDQGDRVSAGQALAGLDQRDQQARVAVAEAELGRAKAALTQAGARLERAKALSVQRDGINKRRQTLVERGTVSRESAEESLANAAMARADVTVAASDVEAARGGIDAALARLALELAILEKSAIKAPYDALVVERARELGSAVGPGVPVLTLLDPATIWVTAYVDEAQAGVLALGQAAEIALRSRPGERFLGRIARIDVENDRVSEERRVQIAFDRIPEPIYLGEQAEVLIEAGRR